MANKSFFSFAPDHRNLPLHYLLETENNLNKVKRLLQEGENPNLKSREGNTPLHIAILNFSENGPIVETLIQAGADINLKNIYRNTPLDFAVIYRKHAVIEILLQAGADVNLRDDDGNRPLHYAIKNCTLFKKMNSKFVCTKSNKLVDFWIIGKLLDHGAEINAQNAFGRSSFSLAAEVGNLQLVRLLLSKGASVNVRDYRCDTPLTVVLEKRTINLTIVFELLRHGAKADITNGNSLTAWQLAIQKYFSSPWWEQEYAKVLMKYFLLFTNEYRTFSMPRPTPRTKKLFQFYQKCIFEAEVLKSDVITKNYTVCDFIANNSDEEYLDEGYPVWKVRDYVFRNLEKGVYGIYVDEIVNRIGRSYLTEKFIKTKVYAKGQCNQVNVCLDIVHLRKISLYLSDLDMFKFIVAKSKPNPFHTGRRLLQRNILRVLHTYAPNFMNTHFVLTFL